MKGYLLLEDGQVFYGRLHGKSGFACGELVFNTSMTGYQEVLTDPSYCRQMVVLTFPEIGIYGTHSHSNESTTSQAAGMVWRHVSSESLPRLADNNLDSFLKSRGIVAISDVDTRHLTLLIRQNGPQKSIIAPDTMPLEKAREHLLHEPPMLGANLVPQVSCTEVITHGSGRWKIGLLDFGVKTSIISNLIKRKCQVIQFPWDTSFETLRTSQLDGLLFSNGPGDPSAVPGVRDVLLKGADEYPVMAICLGYQILALAMGATTFKMPFGHRGGNHPVKNLKTGRVLITAQNHGFAVRPESLPQVQVELTHRSLFDGSLEGFRLRNKPVFGVQFHPEAGPGPSDATVLFDQFLEQVEEFHA